MALLNLLKPNESDSIELIKTLSKILEIVFTMAISTRITLLTAFVAIYTTLFLTKKS